MAESINTYLRQRLSKVEFDKTWKIYMNPKDYLIAKKLKEKLSSMVSVTSLIVFGSRSKGTADEYSDMDVSIVVSSLDKEKKRKYTILCGRWVLKTMLLFPLLFL